MLRELLFLNYLFYFYRVSMSVSGLRHILVYFTYVQLRLIPGAYLSG